MLKNFHKLSSAEKVKLRKKTKIEADKKLASLTEVCNVHSSARFLSMDLSKLGKEDIIKSVCKHLDILPAQLLVVWASPDCSTYSRADASNISRGNHHRDHSKWHRPPKDEIDEKRLKAIQHDVMVQNLLMSMQSFLQLDDSTCFVMENPSASLRHRPFVLIFQILLSLLRHTVDYCAFGAEVKKCTDIWTNFEWSPTGSTGDGRCRQSCMSGKWTFHKGKRPTFRHPEVIAGRNDRRPTGPYAKCRIPAALHREILLAAMEQHCAKGSQAGRTVVLDLFAGSTSLGSVAQELGYDYVAVDYSKASQKCLNRLHTAAAG